MQLKVEKKNCLLLMVKILPPSARHILRCKCVQEWKNIQKCSKDTNGSVSGILGFLSKSYNQVKQNVMKVQANFHLSFIFISLIRSS